MRSHQRKCDIASGMYLAHSIYLNWRFQPLFILSSGFCTFHLLAGAQLLAPDSLVGILIGCRSSSLLI
jgi:hypothetical protein